MNPYFVLGENEVVRLHKAVETTSFLITSIGDWLSHLNLFTDAQIYDILKFVKRRILNHEQNTNSVEILTLTISDGRWVSITGDNRLLDTTTMENVSSLPVLAVTHIICDVIALETKMTQRKNRTDAKDRNSQ